MLFRFIFKGIIRLLIFAIVGSLLLFCIFFAILQTKWVKEQIKEKIVFYLKESGISIRIENLNGQLPFSWTIKETDLSFTNHATLQLSDIKLRIAIFPLLKRKLVINYLRAEKATYSYLPSTEKRFEKEQLFLSLSESKAWFKQQIKQITLPCQINIRYFKVSQIDIIHCKQGSEFSFGMSGAVKIRRDIEEFSFDLKFDSPNHKKTYLEAYLAGNKQTDFIETNIKLHLDEIPTFLNDKFESQVAAEFNLEGPWTTWQEILYGLPRTKEALHGELKAMFANTHIKNVKMLDQNWKFKSKFSILSGQEASIQKFLLLSDLIRVKAAGSLSSDLEKSKIMIAFSLPDLSKMTLPSSLPMTGSAQGSASYQEGTYQASFQTQNLKVNSFALNTLCGLVKGSEEDNEWEAEVKLSSADTDLGLESSFALEFVPEKWISIIDFNLNIPQATMHGYFSYDIKDRLCSSSLFADVENFGQFAPYFKEDYLAGNFSAQCHLLPKEDEQNIHFSVLAKDLRFRDYFINRLTLNAEIEDLFKTPMGQINLLTEKVNTPTFYFDQLDFRTHSDEERWPFYLEANGHAESPFHVLAKGSWQKENSIFSIELTQLFGDLSENFFALKYPCEFEWGVNDLSLTPFDFKIGEGRLYSVFELSPIRSFCKWDVEHFPLEILRCFGPHFKIGGFVSSKGFFDATPENILGSSSIILEEVDVLHFGDKKPFRAKGLLQANLSQKMLQIHTDLYATDEQFLDFTASLPIEYRLYPLCITFDEEKNSSAELTAEGKLQDLFDFVNLGTNHFTGLLSCRLFLSHTLASPSLQGQLEWQNGTYENYFTGIALRNINAKFEAQNDIIRLVRLSANDDKKGEISAEGKILMKPKENFPYAFNIELKNLHALGFDMIDCTLTGPLYLSGNIRDMFAQANLLVDEAKIQIDEQLPYETPTLPFTYINRPLQLYSKTSKPKHEFVFHIDLELSSEGKVLVEGRGLKAELDGNVHLYGTNTNIATSGTLKLIKGEYQFSGKVFKLTEGEIVFNDKPASSAYLNLNGTLSMPDITITAMLRGPLMSPQLTFQSNPQKSTSSILALILFNKDIAYISHPEAIQLASTLMSLSGGAGPNVLETIRKSIGVDRLNITSKPGTDELAVQVGKYLTRGIMITLSQTATSSQVIVEVELPKGFVFQAETQEEEEGKFSLKWRRSY